MAVEVKMRTEAVEMVGERALRVVRVDGRAVDAFDVYGASVWSEVRGMLADALDLNIADAAALGVHIGRDAAVFFRRSVGDLSDLRTEHEVFVGDRALRVVAYLGRPVVAFDGNDSVWGDDAIRREVSAAMLRIVKPEITYSAAKAAFVTDGLPDAMFAEKRATVHHEAQPISTRGT